MRYKALVRIDHNARVFEPGDEIELTPTEAKPLIEAKAIGPFRARFAIQPANETATNTGENHGQ